MYQNSSLPEGKRILSINHIVGTVQAWQTILICQGMAETPKIQVSRDQPGPTLKTGFSEESSLRPAILTSFCVIPLVFFFLIENLNEF